MNFDLINKWGFPCCIYDPTLIEIHQSMWKIEPNVSPFHNRQQQQTTVSSQKLTLQYYYYKMHQNSPKSHIFPRACWSAFLPVKVERRNFVGNCWKDFVLLAILQRSKHYSQFSHTDFLQLCWERDTNEKDKTIKVPKAIITHPMVKNVGLSTRRSGADPGFLKRGGAQIKDWQNLSACGDRGCLRGMCPLRSGENM